MSELRDRWWDSPTREHGKVLRLDLPDGFTTSRGTRFDSIQIAYETWGELNAAADNAVLLEHIITSDCHATGEFRGEPTGWWEPLIGPGRAIDTETCFVVCPNFLGSCYGSTGPRFPAPDGAPWLERFPLLSPLDLMRVQRLFLQQLGIRHMKMVLGPSMGGMVAWEWAMEAPDMVDLVAIVAAPPRTSAQQIGLNWLQREGLQMDVSGDEAAAAAARGQTLARGIGMLSYRSPAGLEDKFGRTWFQPPGTTLGERGLFNVESWLRHQGRRSAKKFDPYSYLLLSRAMDLHDVGEGRGGTDEAARRVRCRTLLVGIDSDQLYPAAEVRAGFEVLRRAGRSTQYAEIHSPHGHDAFLLETAQLDTILREMNP